MKGEVWGKGSPGSYLSETFFNRSGMQKKFFMKN
jgi:hypothetical protein